MIANKENTIALEPIPIPEEITVDQNHAPPAIEPEHPADNDEQREETPLMEHREDIPMEQREKTPIIDDEDEPEPKLPLAQCCSKCVVHPPGKWWKVRKPIPVVPDSDFEEEEIDEMANLVGTLVDPQTYSEAMRGDQADQWQAAMTEEINWHLENTWMPVELPPGQKAIGSKWVYRIKHNADGSIEQFQACVVAKGFNQRPGQDHFEIFASTK